MRYEKQGMVLLIDMSLYNRKRESVHSHQCYFRINFKFLPRCGKLKRFGEFIFIGNAVGLFRTPSGRDVLNCFREKDNVFAVGRNAVLYILVYKSLNMELPQHEFLSHPVIADIADILMHFAFRVLLLRQVRGFILHLNISFVHDERITSFIASVSRLAAAVPFPFTDKIFHRQPETVLLGWLSRENLSGKKKQEGLPTTARI